MPNERGKRTAITWSAFKHAPLTWLLFYTGRALNRLGWGLEKAGAWLMHFAVERLQRKAGR